MEKVNEAIPGEIAGAESHALEKAAPIDMISMYRTVSYLQ